MAIRLGRRANGGTVEGHRGGILAGFRRKEGSANGSTNGEGYADSNPNRSAVWDAFRFTPRELQDLDELSNEEFEQRYGVSKQQGFDEDEEGFAQLGDQAWNDMLAELAPLSGDSTDLAEHYKTIGASLASACTLFHVAVDSLQKDIAGLERYDFGTGLARIQALTEWNNYLNPRLAYYRESLQSLLTNVLRMPEEHSQGIAEHAFAPIVNLTANKMMPPEMIIQRLQEYIDNAQGYLKKFGMLLLTIDARVGMMSSQEPAFAGGLLGREYLYTFAIRATTGVDVKLKPNVTLEGCELDDVLVDTRRAVSGAMDWLTELHLNRKLQGLAKTEPGFLASDSVHLHDLVQREKSAAFAAAGKELQELLKKPDVAALLSLAYTHEQAATPTNPLRYTHEAVVQGALLAMVGAVSLHLQEHLEEVLKFDEAYTGKNMALSTEVSTSISQLLFDVYAGCRDAEAAFLADKKKGVFQSAPNTKMQADKLLPALVAAIVKARQPRSASEAASTDGVGIAQARWREQIQWNPDVVTHIRQLVE